jgi:hypothetical protein
MQHREERCNRDATDMQQRQLSEMTPRYATQIRILVSAFFIGFF